MYVHEDRDIAVSVTYERREAYLAVLIHRLKDGRFQSNTEPFTPETVHNFDFAFLVPKEYRMNPTYSYGSNSVYFTKRNGFKLYIREFARQLKEYGNSVLLGDKSEFLLAATQMLAISRKDTIEK
jgi:hypothetical protein